MQEITHPFPQLPLELNQLIVSHLTRNETINLRLVNKGTRTLINQSEGLRRFDARLSIVPPESLNNMIMAISILVTPVFLEFINISREGLISGSVGSLGFFFGMYPSCMIFGKFTDVVLDDYNWKIIPISILFISTIGTCSLYSSYSFLNGTIYVVQCFFLAKISGIIHSKGKNSLKSMLQNLCFSRLDLSHVNPNKLKLFHRMSDRLACSAFFISQLFLLILTNPIIAITGSMLFAITAKVANLYFHISPAKLHKM